MKMVEVVWDDANFEDEYGLQDSANLEPARLRTAGYLAAETDTGVVIAMTVADSKVDDAEKVVVEQIVIPWGMIVEWGDIS